MCVCVCVWVLVAPLYVPRDVFTRSHTWLMTHTHTHAHTHTRDPFFLQRTDQPPRTRLPFVTKLKPLDGAVDVNQAKAAGTDFEVQQLYFKIEENFQGFN